MLALGDAPRGLAKRAATVGQSQNIAHGARKLIDVTRLDHAGGDPIFEQLPELTESTNDNRFTDCHVLEDLDR
jgi:hypothetical protein